MVEPPIRLTVGGDVQANNGTYLKRPADDQLFEACLNGEFAYVLACRQIGKSSLKNAVAEQLIAEDVRVARIDLNSVGQDVEDVEDWYFSLLDELARTLRLNIDVETWWESKPGRLTLTRRFLRFLDEVVLTEIGGPVVIFIDEIDVTLGLAFTDDFFAAIRAVYSERAQYPAYRRLTFVLLGAATPDQLISDDQRTPFNIGRAITMRDFTLTECAPLRLAIEDQHLGQSDNYLQQIYYWTNGHPYLTQKICAAVANTPPTGDPTLVDNLVHTIYLMKKERSDDSNIQYIQARVLGDPYAPHLLEKYREILQRGIIPDDEKSLPINRLKLYGLIVADNGHLKVRNRIYSAVFDLAWTKEDILPRVEHNRQATLELVKNTWVKGVLEQSLHGAAMIELSLEERVDAVGRPWDMVLQTPDRLSRPLPPGTKIIDVFDEVGQALLILGEPGTGKTTMLLELARDTIARAELDPRQPIPMVFNLSSWTPQTGSVVEWLVAELNTKYNIPQRIARPWVENDDLLLLLDGLDEVGLEHREACVKAINDFRQEHGLTPIVVCGRVADYETLTTRLKLQGAVLLQPLTPQQVDEYLERAGIELLAMRRTLQHDTTFQELAQSPLMLSIMTLAYQGMSVKDLQQLDSIEARRRHVFDVYVQRMFERRGGDKRYSPEQTIRWLAWLAQKMSQHDQTVFLIERMQPSWLPTRAQRWSYVIVSRLLGVLIGALIGTLVGTLINVLTDMWVGWPTGALVGGGIGVLIGYNAAIKHFTLRLILYRNGYIPWNLTRFLDYATERVFLRKVGDGYIFVHRILFEYFASLKLEGAE